MVLDWEEYKSKARQAIAEGVVLLENKNNALPLHEGETVALFGRMQNNYVKSGLGSGGMVNVSEVIGIPEGLINSGRVKLNDGLRKLYDEFCTRFPVSSGNGWGTERYSEEEMPLTDELVMLAARESESAICIIGRTQGEDRDVLNEEGSYLLTETELEMLKLVRKHFGKMIVLLNVGGIIDMSFVESIGPDAVMYIWQGGMLGGDGVADVLTGAVSPSGRLTDTIAKSLECYPSNDHFGDRFKNIYTEDIYVGYRYFETFAKDDVLYPFGYGLSYTDFDMELVDASYNDMAFATKLKVKVTNKGNVKGKQTVMFFMDEPQGKLGHPSRILVDYKKTGELAPGESEIVTVKIDVMGFGSYDDSGVTGFRYAFVLEQGEYKVFFGKDIRDVKEGIAFLVEQTLPVRQLDSAYAPTTAFDRLIAVTDEHGRVVKGSEPTPLKEKDTVYSRNSYRGDIAGERIKNLKLTDVLTDRAAMDSFIYDLSDYDLSCIVCGEGMGSPKVTAGTASAFGAVSPSLDELNIPAMCCADGPSGVRMDCGTKAFSLPIGTLLGCSMNDKLVEELYRFTGMELVTNRVDVLLAPGMNLHRHPLNGRNFEYFSEDPLLTGRMASAVVKGVRAGGGHAVPKHFVGNNQEVGRRTSDSVISERALRELYLKSFEYVVRAGSCDAIMTTYGIVNGIRTSESYDLATRILRDEWNFDGIVMTDWWAFIGERMEVSSDMGFELLVGSGNDVYMVDPESCNGEFVKRSVEILKEGGTRAVNYRANLRRSAANICRFALHTEAMRRLVSKRLDSISEGGKLISAISGNEIDYAPAEVEVINRPKDEDLPEMFEVEYEEMDGEYECDLTYKEAKKGVNYVIPLYMPRRGTYEVELTASSEAAELAQMSVTLFGVGSALGTFTFNGTGGEPVTLKRKVLCFSRNNIYRLYVGADGLKLLKFKIKFFSSEMNINI